MDTQTLLTIQNAVIGLLIWSLLGACFGLAEFLLGVWQRVEGRRFHVRIFLYGPVAWFLVGVAIPILLYMFRPDDGDLRIAPPHGSPHDH